MSSLPVLPIDEHLPGIIDTIAANQVTVLQGGTGIGKTLRLPQALLRRWPDEHVFMTQTRRTAVRWNGKRIAHEMGCRPGETVGWRLVGGQSKVTAATRLELMIDQSLVNRIKNLRGSEPLPAGTLIIDEAHERSISTDLLLGLIKERLPHSPNTRVVITSATIDTQKFSQYFNGAPVVTVEGFCHPVETEAVRLLPGEHHTDGAARAAQTVLDEFLEKGCIRVAGGTASSGTILVLLPGKEDITSVTKSLKATVAKRGESKAQILSCHGGSSSDEQDAIQEELPEGTLRFVCGTEILRSSVTVECTRGVIDSLQIKRLVTDARGVAHLTKIAISRAEADQGKGRAGRTHPGFYMPISFGGEYETLQPFPQPDILRAPLSNVVLQVAAAGLNARHFDFIDPPPEEKLEVVLSRLQQLGALDERERITAMGRTLVRFPLDPERAKALVVARDLDVLPEILVVTAALEAEGFFYRPRQNDDVTLDASETEWVLAHLAQDTAGWWHKLDEPRLPETVSLDVRPSWIIPENGEYRVCCREAHINHHSPRQWIGHLLRKRWANGTGNDFVSILNAFRAFKAKEEQLRRQAKAQTENPISNAEREKRLRQWCIDHSLLQKHLRMVEQKIRQIREELHGELKLTRSLFNEQPVDVASLSKALLAGLFDNLGCRDTYRASGQYRGPLGEFQLGYQSICPPDSTIVLTAGLRHLHKKLDVADIAAPMEQSWVDEMLPHAIERRTGMRPWYNTEIGVVFSTVERRLFGFELGRIEVPDPTHPNTAELRRDALNELKWQAWMYPKVALPTSLEGDPEAVIPPVYIETYGTDEDGTALLAYGAVTFLGERWQSTARDSFRVLWTRDKTEADMTRRATVRRLQNVRDRTVLDALKTQAAPLASRLDSLYANHATNMDLPLTLWTQLEAIHFQPRPTDPPTLTTWIERAQQLVDAVQASAATIKSERDELRARALKLAEQISRLFQEEDNLDKLTDEQYYQLTDLDVGEDVPEVLPELKAWIDQATTALRDVEAAIQPQPPTKPAAPEQLAGPEHLARLANYYRNRP